MDWTAASSLAPPTTGDSDERVVVVVVVTGTGDWAEMGWLGTGREDP